MEAAKVIHMSRSEPADLIREGALLKERIAGDKVRLDEIETRLAELAYDPDKLTTRLQGEGVTAKITRKTIVNWDQDKLAQARSKFGDQVFFSLFGWKFEPLSKKKLDGFLEFATPEDKRPVLDAMTTKPGKPSVAYERTEA